MKIREGLMHNVTMGFLVVMFSAAVSSIALAQSEQPKDNGLTQVESKYVCMINNQHFNKQQIPIAVKGQTYYGCCEMCKAKLRKDAKSRVAVDPVSGKTVDKAKAVIGAASDGTVYYFESVKNLKRFRSRS